MSNNKKTLLQSSEGLEALKRFQRVGHAMAVANPSTQSSTVRELGRMIEFDSLRQDGEDHINIAREATTAIGKAFSLASPAPYYDQVLKIQVPSIDAFFQFITSESDDLNDLVNYRPRRRGVRKDNPFFNHSLHTSLMAWAMYQKIMSYSDLRTVLSQLTVPVDCYFYVGSDTTTRHRKPAGAACAIMVNLMVDAVAKNLLPDVRFFISPYEASKLSDSPKDRFEGMEIFKDKIAYILSDLKNFENTNGVSDVKEKFDQAVASLTEINTKQSLALAPTPAQDTPFNPPGSTQVIPPMELNITQPNPVMDQLVQAGVDSATGVTGVQDLATTGMSLAAAPDAVELPADAFEDGHKSID